MIWSPNYQAPEAGHLPPCHLNGSPPCSPYKVITGPAERERASGGPTDSLPHQVTRSFILLSSSLARSLADTGAALLKHLVSEHFYCLKNF